MIESLGYLKFDIMPSSDMMELTMPRAAGDRYAQERQHAIDRAIAHDELATMSEFATSLQLITSVLRAAVDQATENLILACHSSGSRKRHRFKRLCDTDAPKRVFEMRSDH